MMRTRLKLNPGQRGTIKLVRQYGAQLVCVRYRYDEEKQRRYKTIELIIDEAEWMRKPRPGTIVYLRVAYSELVIRTKIKQAGGQWDSNLALWRLRFDQAEKLGLQKRIVRPKSI